MWGKVAGCQAVGRQAGNMAALQQAPEIQLAQRLASNEKIIRSKAIKKLRKYIRIRSQRVEGAFNGDELLKLWKGLFYCLWMQDKPLLQEELSNQIAGLLHSFQTVDMQFLYLETFLQTMKREWTGIDRLRMDKFFQLVRFVFRQTFEMLKRRGWETSVVATFLELLAHQVLQRTGEAPSGLQFHILDLYITELAGVGSAQLSAEQNMKFIEPFCKSAAKTKDRILLRAICSSIFRTIIDQAPFAIEDLMLEMKTSRAEDSDSGQASEEEDSDSGQASEEEEAEHVQKSKSKLAGKKALRKSTGKKMNGTASTEDEEDDEDDTLLHLEDGSDTELPDDEGIGPVLQFDYGALADRLFGLASHSNTPSFNRQKLYKLIKTLRDLSEGVFPQDDYPEEVSTDEDDDLFGSRKRMKRGRGLGEEEDEGGDRAAKKAKGKKKEAFKPGKSDEGKPVDDTSDATNKKKKKKKKKAKSGDVKEQTGQEEGSEVKAMAVVSDNTSESAVQTAECEKKDIEKAEPSLLDSTDAQTENSAPSEATEAVASMETETQSETPEPSTIVVGSQSVVTITEEAAEPEPLVTEGHQEDQSETGAAEEEPPLNPPEKPLPDTASPKKRKRRKKSGPNSEECEPSVEVAKAAGDQPAPGAHDEEVAEGAAEPESVPETAETPATADPGAKKNRRKSNKQQQPEEKTAQTEAESPEAELVTRVEVSPSPAADAEGAPTEDAAATATPLKKAARGKKAKRQETTQTESAEAEATPAETPEDATTADDSAVGATPVKRKKKAKVSKASDQVAEDEVESRSGAETPVAATTTPNKKKKRNAPAQEEEVEGETQPGVEGSEPSESGSELPAPLKKGKKRRKIPVVIEVEAEELEAAAEEEEAAEAARLNGLARAGGKKPKMSNRPSTPTSTKKLGKTLKVKKDKAGSGNDFITFQSRAPVPSPIFCRTPLASKKTLKKLLLTPKSEAKKVTFGLKNNKTAEFRKNDRSLLVSPEGTSRVPFDPQQKPLFGVLKSPTSSPITSTKKSLKMAKNTPKGRPTAADFF